MLDMFPVDVPYPKESKDEYQKTFIKASVIFPQMYDKVILCEAAVLSGNNYIWIKKVLLDLGYKNENIITTALIEMTTSIFNCDYVAEYSTKMPEFYYERHNKHWDS